MTIVSPLCFDPGTTPSALSTGSAAAMPSFGPLSCSARAWAYAFWTTGCASPAGSCCTIMVRLSTGKPNASAARVSATIAGLSVEVMSLMPPLRVESEGSSTAAAIAPPTQASTINQRSDTTTPASAYARREPGRPEGPGVLSMVTGVTSRTLARLPGPARRAAPHRSRRHGSGSWGGGRDGDRQLLALARPGSGMPHFCRAALVAGLVTSFATSAAAPTGSLLVGVGRFAACRHCAMAAAWPDADDARLAPELATAPAESVAEPPTAGEVAGLVVGLVDGVVDDTLDADDPDEQAATPSSAARAGTASTEARTRGLADMIGSWGRGLRSAAFYPVSTVFMSVFMSAMGPPPPPCVDHAIRVDHALLVDQRQMATTSIPDRHTEAGGLSRGFEALAHDQRGLHDQRGVHDQRWGTRADDATGDGYTPSERPTISFMISVVPP